ncbi:hypothetical protein B0H13DRAFT_2082098 [Mycena leptocephala]|nr:hypothetical protein B0H13DRAFT_2082098 [Mycena leptocephala]
MASSATTEDVIIIILAIILPPVAVVLMKKPPVDIIINIALTFLGFWILGVVHALYLYYQRRRSWF